MPARVGLVLGGGGVVGVAWEVGILAGLASALSWDSASAAVVVGTSAGSIVGTQLRRGTTFDALVDEQRTGTGGEAPSAPPDLEALAEVFGLWGGAEEMTADVARRVAERATTARTVAEDDWVQGITTAVGGDGWPGGDLRVTAVSVATGERSVWDAGSGVPLGRAVAGSCSVPGLFPPVQVGPERFVDGGVWSGSNADVLLGRGVDVAVFVGPLVGETGVGRVSARALEREQAELAAAGIPLHSVVPGAAFAALGANLMDSSMRAEAVDVGRAEGAQAAADLAPLVLA